MKKLFLLTCVVMLGMAQYADACTNFIVGKDASADGSTMITYAADSYGFYGFLRYRAAADHQPGEMIQLLNWDNGKPMVKIEQVAHTYTVVGNMNEHQVTIGETTFGGKDLADTVGIDYGNLIYLALERSKTAREAIQCMTDLVAKYGYASGGESFSIGDPNEVWIMEMIGKGKGVKGAVWVATRIPDDCISGHANQSRITYLPLDQKTTKKGDVVMTKDGNWLWHKDVIKVARDNGFFSGKDSEFQFNHAYNPFDFTGLYACEARVWSFFRHFDNDFDRYFGYATGKIFLATGKRDAGEPMPLYIKPNHKITVQEMKECMRDEYQGTELDMTKGIDAGPFHSKLRYASLVWKLDSTDYCFERPIATQQTAWSFVAQMRGYESAKAGGIFWFGVDDAANSLHIPMYCTINEVPECMKEGNGDTYTYSPTSAWWAWNMVANWAYTRYSDMRPDIQKVQQTWDDKFNSQVEIIDQEVAGMSKDEARAFLTKYSCAQAEQATAAWKDLFIYLYTKYLDGRTAREENGEFKRNQWGYPVGGKPTAYPREFQELFKHEVWHE
ncbi:MAG: C69 family dipeptidase [Paludibacteraceae bacterium]|nr:C69 family dipeptidase [Paludibacteraceae bacterium]